MARRSTNKADLEYALMMTILNFHTEFMRSNYANVQVHMSQDQIEVTLTRQGSVPAEMRLAESPEGRALLRRMRHTPPCDTTGLIGLSRMRLQRSMPAIPGFMRSGTRSTAFRRPDLTNPAGMLSKGRLKLPNKSAIARPGIKTPWSCSPPRIAGKSPLTLDRRDARWIWR